MNTILLKRIFKKMIPLLPGYHFLCQLLLKLKPKGWEWVNRIPVKPGLIVTVHSKAGDFYMGRPERCSIAKKFFWTQGLREPEEDRIALDIFSSLVKCSDVVLDIGANSGLFSLVAAKMSPKADIVAFDIFPEACHILIDNLILNGLLEKVEVKLIGVGKKGSIFYAPFNNITSEMPTGLSLDCKDIRGARIQVPIKTLDEICLPRFIGKRMCIKIDVEGTEVDIFASGRQTLRAIKPDIICEVLPGARQIASYDQILDDYSYHKYLITNNGLKKFDVINPHDCFRDWLFTTKNNFDAEILC